MELTRKIAAGLTVLSTGLMMATPVLGQDLNQLLQQLLQWLQQNPQVVQQVQNLAPQVVGQLTGAPSACQGVTFNRDLKMGMSGTDVRCLQALLNQDPETKVADTGPGSPGNETTYFGAKTKAAVVKFQEKYRDEILTPVGLTAGTGYVGAKTRAKLNSLLTTGISLPVPQPQQPTQPEQPSPQPQQPTETPAEGTLTVSWQVTPTGVDVKEGETKNVAAFKVKATGSSIKVQRVDLQITGGVPWKALSSIALYDGANLIKEMAVTKANLIENTAGSDYTARFTSSELFTVGKDSEKVITVQVTALGTFSSGYPGTITLQVPSNGVRGVDTAGINQYAGATGSRQFTLSSAASAQLEMSLNANSPKSRIVVIDEDTDNEVELTKVNLKAKNRDVKLTDLAVSVTTSGTYGTGKALRLYDGDTLLAERAVSNGTFEDLEVSIAKDSTKTLTVKLVVTGTAAGGYVDVNVVTSSSAAIDADYNTVTLTGGADGDPVYLYNVAPQVALDTTSISKLDDAGKIYQFTIKFKVTAVGGDVWIASSTVSNSASQSDKITVYYETTASTPASPSAIALNSSATQETGGAQWYKVAENQTETFTVSFVINATGTSGAAGNYKGKIVGIAWNTENSTTSSKKLDYTWLVKDLVTANQYIVAP